MESPVSLIVSYLDQDDNQSKLEEITLENNLTPIKVLAEKIGQVFNTSPEDCDLYYGIKCLDCTSEKDISQLAIRSGCRIYAIKKKSPQTVRLDKVELSVLQNAIHGLHLMFHNAEKKRRAKTPIARLFEDQEAMKSIISSVEGLSHDQTALDILENRKLFEILVHPKNAKMILENHPSLAAAIATIWQSLTSSNRYSSFGTSPGTSQSGMEVEEALLPPISDRPSTSSSSLAESNRANIITSSQLAAAIARATSHEAASSFSYSSYNTPSSSSVQSPLNVGSVNRSGATTPADGTNSAGGQQNPPRQLITPDVFSQAMQQALMSTPSPTSSVQADGPQPVSEDVMKAGLDQLRAMGITDDAASRQALTATHGNVEAAVNILFSSN